VTVEEAGSAAVEELEAETMFEAEVEVVSETAVKRKLVFGTGTEVGLKTAAESVAGLELLPH
jgi:hypothetical protein